MTACDTDRLTTRDILKTQLGGIARPNAFIRNRVRSNKATPTALAAFLVKVKQTLKDRSPGRLAQA
jgi:hypothetical protein